MHPLTQPLTLTHTLSPSLTPSHPHSHPLTHHHTQLHGGRWKLLRYLGVAFSRTTVGVWIGAAIDCKTRSVFHIHHHFLIIHLTGITHPYITYPLSHTLSHTSSSVPASQHTFDHIIYIPSLTYSLSHTLLSSVGLSSTSTIIFSGGSAGARGVMVLIDLLVKEHFPQGAKVNQPTNTPTTSSPHNIITPTPSPHNITSIIIIITPHHHHPTSSSTTSPTARYSSSATFIITKPRRCIVIMYYYFIPLCIN